MSPIRSLLIPSLFAALAFVPAARAACPQELAVYSETGAGASLEFTPAEAGAITSHSFKVKFPENAVILDGIVMTTDNVVRTHGILMHKCPTGDVTGEELAACTVWEGTIYAVDDKGEVGELPAQGQPFAYRLILTDLAAYLRESSVWGVGNLSKLPGDVFAMSGCQE
ncbi:MAG: hypothetical protein WBF87_18505 [Mesorhizobium sp.]